MIEAQQARNPIWELVMNESVDAGLVQFEEV